MLDRDGREGRDGQRSATLEHGICGGLMPVKDDASFGSLACGRDLSGILSVPRSPLDIPSLVRIHRIPHLPRSPTRIFVNHAGRVNNMSDLSLMSHSSGCTTYPPKLPKRSRTLDYRCVCRVPSRQKLSTSEGLGSVTGNCRESE